MMLNSRLAFFRRNTDVKGFRSILRRIANAALLELSVLGDDQHGAVEALGNALAAVRESWEPNTTAR